MLKEFWQAAELAGNATLVFLLPVLLPEIVNSELKTRQ